MEWVEGEGLFGMVEMTARAAAAIDGKEYLYFSPVFLYASDSGEVLQITMGALTNHPAIHGMNPITGAQVADFLADGLDHAGYLTARGEGEGRFELVLAFDNQGVGEVDPGRMDFE